LAISTFFEKAFDLRASEAHVTAQTNYGKLSQVAVYPASGDTEDSCWFIGIYTAS